MDWKQVGKTVVGMGLPLLGSVLLGGTGQRGGELIAEALGCEPEPKAVAQRIAIDPAAAFKLAEVQADNELELTRLENEALRTVNATMQVEAQSEKWWVSAWRPFWGFVSAVAFAFTVLGFLALAAYAIAMSDVQALNILPQLAGQLAFLFGVPAAILGIASWHRGVTQRVKAMNGGQGPPSAPQLPAGLGARIADAASALVGKRKP